MVKLIPVKYNNREYPVEIQPKIQEVAGHFDIEKIEPNMKFSLHTEYSYSERKMNSRLLKDLDEIKSATVNNIPMLWFSEKWAKEFYEFIRRLIIDNQQKAYLIEIHPPFSDYTKSISDFIKRYKIFEYEVKNSFPHINILDRK